MHARFAPTPRSPRDSSQTVSSLYRTVHDLMRSVDGLQPHEAFDELLKYVFLRQRTSWRGSDAAAFGKGLFASRAVGAAALRQEYRKCLEGQRSLRAEGWANGFRLSDKALAALEQELSEVDFAALRFDAHAAALRGFLKPTVRRGLGIYPTPDGVVDAVVGALSPEPDASVYDPACGTGTFLASVLRAWAGRGQGVVHGSDFSERMAFLTELALGRDEGRVRVNVQDSLSAPSLPPDWPSHFDYVLTNPPFGTYIGRMDAAAAGYSVIGGGSASVPGEVLLLERSLRWLKPGGKLGIVLPRSVVTNAGLAGARAVVDRLAVLVGVMNLPPETFAGTGTGTVTSVLFFERREERSGPLVRVPVVDVRNVGFDGTGRARDGSELPAAAMTLRAAMRDRHPASDTVTRELPAGGRLGALGIAGGTSALGEHVAVGEYIASASTGRTPARAAYADRGAFIVKVGNLTGQGLDWSPRDRNFVASPVVGTRHELRPGDVVLTSSAHHPKYIGDKVDVIDRVPPWLGGGLTFVGEVMRLRPKEAVDPYWLLALVRHPYVRSAMQESIRGQTAHLSPKDVLAIRVPRAALPTDRLVALLREEASHAYRLSLIQQDKRECYRATMAGHDGGLLAS